VTFSCSSCSYTEEKTIDEASLEEGVEFDCSSCSGNSQLEIIDKKDLIDDLSDLAEKTSCDVKLISQNSEEGDSLISAFGGIAGISRYPLELDD
jgi:peptide chain release factor subunit 1